MTSCLLSLRCRVGEVHVYDMPWSRGIVVVIGCELVAEGISGASLLEIL